jgi:hypothetical protein
VLKPIKLKRLLNVVNEKLQFHISSSEYVPEALSKSEAEIKSAEMH